MDNAPKCSVIPLIWERMVDGAGHPTDLHRAWCPLFEKHFWAEHADMIPRIEGRRTARIMKVIQEAKMSDVPTGKIATAKHIARVAEYMTAAASEIWLRGQNHDDSKFNPIEAGPLQVVQDIIDREGEAPYGSDEYKRRTAILEPMLAHHYANNRHHPEHYPNGINGFDLFDLMEMFFDWRVASERGEESAMNLTTACAKYNISPQLQEIMQNTADRLSYAWK